MSKLLVVCGPTATGKTAVSLELACRFNGSLISADSRQVYKGMDIGTGKDIPKEFKIQNSEFRIEEKNKKIPYYSDGKIDIWGLDLVNPDEEFSINHYRNFAIPLIEKLWKENKLPIIVGGSGLYLKALLEPVETIHIPINKSLRTSFENKAIITLQQDLKKLNEKRYLKMNNSDLNNSRRLVRAIEIEVWKKQKLGVEKNEYASYYQKIKPFIIGLTASKGKIDASIARRVDLRMQQGLISEIRALLAKGYNWQLPAFSALGYREWQSYFVNGENEQLKKEVIMQWKKDEIHFAHRQLTWFKKQKDIYWFNVEKSNFQKLVLDMVKKWYTK